MERKIDNDRIGHLQALESLIDFAVFHIKDMATYSDSDYRFNVYDEAYLHGLCEDVIKTSKSVTGSRLNPLLFRKFGPIS